MLIASKISICGSSESGFIVSVGVECDSDDCLCISVCKPMLCHGVFVCVCESIYLYFPIC